MSPHPEPQRFFFVHVLKSAGTDLFTRLGGDPAIALEHEVPFPYAALYPNDTDGDVFTVAPQLAVDQLLERWAARKDEIRVIMGHFPLCTVELLDRPFTTLSTLREPIERTLSFLRHHRRLTPQDRDKPLEEIYEDPDRFDMLIHDHMVKVFSLSTDEMTAGILTRVTFDRDRLERAKEGVASIDLLGTQEHFEEFCAELEHRYGWALGPPFFANRTQPVDVPASFRRRIAEDNALDVELYEFALDEIARRARV